MSGILCSFVGGSYGAPIPEIGEAYEGGFFAGQINDGGTVYNLVVAPKSSGESSSIQWKTSRTATSGTSSGTDGLSNTSAMDDASHPAAQFCTGLSIGGFSDWYMPARFELEILYYNLKPATTSNNTSTGANGAAVPPRGSNYTAGNPAQTSVTDFVDGNTEAFELNDYWTSTEYSLDTGRAYRRGMETGDEFNVVKDNSYHLRAIRRVAA